VSWLWDILGFAGKGYGVDELARRLDLQQSELHDLELKYREFAIPKRAGGRRRILAPVPELKAVQRRILRRLLNGLKTHAAATGFQRGESFLSNAQRHQGQAVVIRLDIKDFFPSTEAKRVKKYFRAIGWNRKAANLLVRLCTTEGSLPQGAPTSPRLSNLVNYLLDARLSGLAAKHNAVYTRYADDLTFSFAEDRRAGIGWLMKVVRDIVQQEGYQLHGRRKKHVRRRHQRQEVTGLVVNDRANLPRKTRRWLRAVEHRAAMDRQPLSVLGGADYLRRRKKPTLTDEELQGWRALTAMIDGQATVE